MASFSNSVPRSETPDPNRVSRLYRFALVLTANEKLAGALFRSAFRSESDIFSGKNRGDPMRRIYALWAAKSSAAPDISGREGPDIRLFSGLPLKGSFAPNAHYSKFIADLPGSQRAALYLVYGEGLSYDEAADVLSLNMLALMKLLARGHTALAHWLDRRGLREGTALGGETRRDVSSATQGREERAA